MLRYVTRLLTHINVIKNKNYKCGKVTYQKLSNARLYSSHFNKRLSSWRVDRTRRCSVVPSGRRCMTKSRCSYRATKFGIHVPWPAEELLGSTRQHQGAGTPRKPFCETYPIFTQKQLNLESQHFISTRTTVVRLADVYDAQPDPRRTRTFTDVIIIIIIIITLQSRLK